MQILVAVIAGLILLVVLPLLIAWMKTSTRLKTRRRAIGGGIDAAFGMFDPAKARALQVIERRKEIGHADEGGQGDLHDPPPR